MLPRCLRITTIRFRSSAMIVMLGAKRSFTFLGTSAVTAKRVHRTKLAPLDSDGWSINEERCMRTRIMTLILPIGPYKLSKIRSSKSFDSNVGVVLCRDAKEMEQRAIAAAFAYDQEDYCVVLITHSAHQCPFII
ncbi:hypothetical protein Vadar_014928 [Vaccinium darrowii]|uniref:Uncharacterized protein n=1 Tax=Vaccinium darrowii TaxID=229202 RepID=A0ACB7XA22_9ERIC|nr:hypothetical protein Vadar_014928 [Vaccinium darrowii]